MDIEKIYSAAVAAYTDKVDTYMTKVLADLRDNDDAEYGDVESAVKGIPSVYEAFSLTDTDVKLEIDATPLTKKDRDDMLAKRSEVAKKARGAMLRKAREAENTIETEAKRIAIGMQYFSSAFAKLSDKTANKIYNDAWAIAYERGHSGGLSEVMSEFGDILDFADRVVSSAAEGLF